jgi:hypothetical protein
LDLFDLLKKTSYVVTDELLLSLINLAIKKDYTNFFDIVFRNLDINYKSIIYKDIYIIKDCLFLVNDLDSLLSSLGRLGYIVKRGHKSKTLNTMSTFLSYFDVDFRENLYKQQANFVKQGILPYGALLSRSKLSFNKIHMNLGNIIYYYKVLIYIRLVTVTVTTIIIIIIIKI